MKLINVNTKVILALLTAIVTTTSVPAQEEETGFTLEDSIRAQIFLELKSNVENLYQGGRLLVPDVDTSTAARIASSNDNNGFVLPVNIDGNTTNNTGSVETIN